MSFLSKILGGGSVGKKARRRATAIQRAATTEARGVVEGGAETARGDLQPFTEAGLDSLGRVQSLINDPNAQKDFLVENPFFELLKKDATDTLFSNQASRGKVGSGETAKALQNSFLLLGQGLINNNVNQNMDLVTGGQNAATNQGRFSTSGASTVADLITGQANAEASSILGLQRDKNQRDQNVRDNIFSLAGATVGAAGPAGGFSKIFV